MGRTGCPFLNGGTKTLRLNLYILPTIVNRRHSPGDFHQVTSEQDGHEQGRVLNSFHRMWLAPFEIDPVTCSQVDCLVR